MTRMARTVEPLITRTTRLFVPSASSAQSAASLFWLRLRRAKPFVVPSLFPYQIAIRFRPPVTEELPDIAHLLNLIEIQIRDDNFFCVARAFRNELSARRAEVTLAVEFADV